VRVPIELENFDESMTNKGRRVGMQAEMMPLEHSMRHQVHALARVQGVSAGSNSKSVEKR
jgi:predicted RNA-binding protein Jag